MKLPLQEGGLIEEERRPLDLAAGSAPLGAVVIPVELDAVARGVVDERPIAKNDCGAMWALPETDTSEKCMIMSMSMIMSMIILKMTKRDGAGCR